jgi:uncharacterized membrane protein YqjE
MAEIHIDRRGDDLAEEAVPPAGAPPVREHSLGDLFRQLAEDSTTLIRQEIALAKSEMRETVRTVSRDIAMIAVGGVIALVGVLTLTAFLVLLLGALMANYWLAALIVGVVYLLIGGGLAYSNLNNLRKSELKPEHSIESLKEDKQWVQHEIRDAKRELT